MQSKPTHHSSDLAAVGTTNGATSFRFIVVALAFLITLVNYMDRSAISYAVGPIKQEFALNDTQFGSIAAAFGVGYMIMTLGGGIIVDRWGARIAWSAAAILWSGLTALMGRANGFSTLCALRVFLGLAEGPHFPSLTRMVSDWLPQPERAMSTGIGLCAVPLASAIGAPLISSLILSVGWKSMFAVMASLGVLWAIIWFWIFRDYPESCKFVGPAELKLIRQGQIIQPGITDDERRKTMRQEGTTTWRKLLTNRSLLANNVAYFAFGYSLFFALNWLPGYLEHTYGVRLKEAGFLLIAPWLTAAVLLPCAGWLSDWLLIKTGSKRVARSHLICACQLISALAYVPMLLSPPLPIAIALISIGVGFGMMPNAAFYAINWDLARDRAATSQGLMTSCSSVASILAPILTGFIATKTGSFTGAFAILIFFTVVSVISVTAFQRLDDD